MLSIKIIPEMISTRLSISLRKIDPLTINRREENSIIWRYGSIPKSNVRNVSAAMRSIPPRILTNILSGLESGLLRL